MEVIYPISRFVWDINSKWHVRNILLTILTSKYKYRMNRIINRIRPSIIRVIRVMTVIVSRHAGYGQNIGTGLPIRAATVHTQCTGYSAHHAQPYSRPGRPRDTSPCVTSFVNTILNAATARCSTAVSDGHHLRLVVARPTQRFRLFLSHRNMFYIRPWKQ